MINIYYLVNPDYILNSTNLLKIIPARQFNRKVILFDSQYSKYSVITDYGKNPGILQLSKGL